MDTMMTTKHSAQNIILNQHNSLLEKNDFFKISIIEYI